MPPFDAIEFIDSPTEQTTAITDAILAVMALAAVAYLGVIGGSHPWKRKVWQAAFGFLALAATLGAIVHGFKMSQATSLYLWTPLYLSLGLVVSFFAVGVVYDVWGEVVSRRVLWPILGTAAIFFIATLLVGEFWVFILYEGIAMLFALGAYTWLAVQRRLNGATWLAFGVLVTIIAAGVQATGSLSATIIWPFDHNGLFHLIQMVGVVLLLLGLRAGLQTEATA